MGKKTGSSGDIFRNNSKVRFKMFKAGKRWLVAGTATLSGLLGGLLIAPHAVNADTTTTTVAKTVDQQDTLATQDTATIPVSSQTGSQTTSTDASASIEASTSTSVSISQSASESALVSESASQSGSTTESESSSTQSSTSSSTSTATSTSATSASSVAVKATTTADTTQTLGTQLGLVQKILHQSKMAS